MIAARLEAEMRPVLFACSDVAPSGALIDTGNRDGGAGLSRRQLRKRRAAERQAAASGTVPSSAATGVQRGGAPVQPPVEAGLGASTVHGEMGVLQFRSLIL